MSTIKRRDFIKTVGAAALVGALPNAIFSKPKEKVIWGNLLHLSFNMWEDWDAPSKEMRSYRPYLRFDEKLWNDLLIKMADNYLNMVVIDLGDGVQYKSHPGIAVEKAWSIKKLNLLLHTMHGWENIQDVCQQRNITKSVQI